MIVGVPQERTTRARPHRQTVVPAPMPAPVIPEENLGPSQDLISQVARELDRKETTVLRYVQYVLLVLEMHDLNHQKRAGVAQLKWSREDPETVQGHTGATKMMATCLNQFKFLAGWSFGEVDHLETMMEWHEVDEVGKGDTSSHSMWDKVKGKYKSREQWYRDRFTEYFEKGGRDRVAAVLTRSCSTPNGKLNSFGQRILDLNDEFAEAETRTARLANQIDALQCSFEAASRAYNQGEDTHKWHNVTVGPRWNFGNYVEQARLILESNTLIMILRVLEIIVKMRQQELQQVALTSASVR